MLHTRYCISAFHSSSIRGYIVLHNDLLVVQYHIWLVTANISTRCCPRKIEENQQPNERPESHTPSNSTVGYSAPAARPARLAVALSYASVYNQRDKQKKTNNTARYKYSNNDGIVIHKNTAAPTERPENSPPCKIYTLKIRPSDVMLATLNNHPSLYAPNAEQIHCCRTEPLNPNAHAK